MIPPRYTVEKTYPQRGPMQQYRLAEGCAFHCFRCGQDKKSKLVTVFRDEWEHLLCNGCYGRLLSIHEIKRGTLDDDARAAALYDVLLGLVPNSEAENLAHVIAIRDGRTRSLSAKVMRLLASSEYVATRLTHTTGLDWSAAVIGLCKAFEVALVDRLHDRLRAACAAKDLVADCADKDMGRVAKYCAGKNSVPPELGSTRHFLETAANSTARRGTSALLQALTALVREWPHSDWLFGPALAQLEQLAIEYRNRAAHTDELGPGEYNGCHTLVLGPDGMMWRLVHATTPRA